MKTKKLWLGMLILVLAFGMTVIGCGDGGDDNNGVIDVPPAEKTPLTGTVTITSAVTYEYATKSPFQGEMTLTADTSGLNPTNSYGYSYQWQRNNTNITSATQKTYKVAEADFGQSLKVIVTNSSHTGSAEAQSQSTNHTPTICNVKIQIANDAFKKDGVNFHNENNQYILGGTNGSTTKLWSYSSSPVKFKIADKYTFVGSNFYYKNGITGPETFELTNGNKTYNLTNADGGFSQLTGLVATE
jgi:hypothetical protein